MKYTYWSTTCSGKMLLRSLFWLNNRSTCDMTAGNPIWVTLTKPFGKLYKFDWYWCDVDGILQTHSHFLDVSDKILDPHYLMKWFPIPDRHGNYCLPEYEWTNHANFWGCIDSIIERDMIVNPFSLLGYVGKDVHKLLEQVKTGDPPFTPAPDILNKLRQRVSIVAYKEDIEHLAYNCFTKSLDPIDKTIRNINQHRLFQKYMPVFLEKNKIEYEMFSLDRGDYAKTFRLDNTLPRDSTDNMLCVKTDVTKLVKNYMDDYHNLC